MAGTVPATQATMSYPTVRFGLNTRLRENRYLARGVGKMCQAYMDDAMDWPTCSMHYGLVTERDSLYEWVWQSLSGPHGPVHFWIGGTARPTTAPYCVFTLSRSTHLSSREVLSLVRIVHAPASCPRVEIQQNGLRLPTLLIFSVSRCCTRKDGNGR